MQDAQNWAERTHDLLKLVNDPGQDVLSTVLRGHLFTEMYLEQIIEIFLPRGGIILAEGRLTYYQKLMLVSSFDILNEGVIILLKSLNKLRNQCAHGLEKKISMSEIEALGNLLGGEYLNHWRRTYKDAHGRILNNVVSCICLIITLSVMKLKKKSEDSVTAENKHTDKKGKAGSSHAKK